MLPDWFRKPHQKYGTTYRVLNVIVGLQLLTLVLSRGDVYLLGEAYAFGVVWSFALKSLAVLVLRYREPGPREWRVPFNLRIGGLELPVGLALITAGAVRDRDRQPVHQAAGHDLGRDLHRRSLRRLRRCPSATTRAGDARRNAAGGLDQFQLLPASDLGLADVAARPGNVLVPVRDYNTLAHLNWALTHVDTERHDVVAMTVRLLQGPDSGIRRLAPGGDLHRLRATALHEGRRGRRAAGPAGQAPGGALVERVRRHRPDRRPAVVQRDRARRLGQVRRVRPGAAPRARPGSAWRAATSCAPASSPTS